ncbi:hypothetical protein TPHA_0D04575 [Tetrapisispora phaffii CBS 4417]|uniref:Small ribosomal subunit protein mS38 n=1 Tax=Tetrapisispora phaffii (strain ATCC 24235 / CBS 4417 / NBRC 1672 / NRRL Y-8282 / UCD 70-5) TaxID=1071381 RepID=G8BS17_TETPH|nr:hypothetical protein TPHA_0D04575 [Tetrapisispora phaffii CBS 4417]CCE63092.1 hypothetical protein TPHA_0D04575 [Tetrapisispora phaffii CBS 4417]
MFGIVRNCAWKAPRALHGVFNLKLRKNYLHTFVDSRASSILGNPVINSKVLVQLNLRPLAPLAPVRDVPHQNIVEMELDSVMRKRKKKMKKHKLRKRRKREKAEKRKLSQGR